MKRKTSASAKRSLRKSQNPTAASGGKQKKNQAVLKGEEANCGSGVCALTWKPAQASR